MEIACVLFFFSSSNASVKAPAGACADELAEARRSVGTGANTVLKEKVSDRSLKIEICYMADFVFNRAFDTVLNVIISSPIEVIIAANAKSNLKRRREKKKEKEEKRKRKRYHFF